jgi:hypothetical protein
MKNEQPIDKIYAWVSTQEDNREFSEGIVAGILQGMVFPFVTSHLEHALALEENARMIGEEENRDVRLVCFERAIVLKEINR